MKLIRSYLLLALASIALGAAPLAAQANAQLVTPGQPLTGRLEATDPKLEDGSFFDLFLYLGQPGDQLVITLRSPDFDAYLSGGLLSGTTFDAQDTDDDGDGGTDAKLTVTVGSSGRYAIRANSLEPGKTGGYSIRVELVSGPSAGGRAQPQANQAQTVAGPPRAIGAGETI